LPPPIAQPAPGAGDQHRQILEIVLDGHDGLRYSSASFHASPWRTIQPEVGSQK
jgi:hypothetical protein